MGFWEAGGGGGRGGGDLHVFFNPKIPPWDFFFLQSVKRFSARTEPRMEREGTKTMKGEKLKKEEQREEGRGEKKDLCL